MRSLFAAAIFLACSSCSFLDYGSLDNAFDAGKIGQSADGGATSSDGGGSKTISIAGTTQAGPTMASQIVVPLPSSAQVGDVDWIIVAARDDTGVTVPSGFTSHEVKSGSCGGYRTTFLTNVVAQGDTSYTFVLSASDTVAAILTTFHNANPIPNAENFDRADGDGTGKMTVPAIPVSSTNEVQWLGINSVYDSGGWKAPSAMTLLASGDFLAAFTSIGVSGSTTGDQIVQGPMENGGCGGFGFVSLTVAK